MRLTRGSRVIDCLQQVHDTQTPRRNTPISEFVDKQDIVGVYFGILWRTPPLTITRRELSR